MLKINTNCPEEPYFVAGAEDQDLLMRSYTESRFANVSDIVLGYYEEKVVLRKCVSYRLALCRSMVANCRDGYIWRTSLGLALAAAKLSVDAVAVSTGLQHRLLRHRAKTAACEEVARWNQVWQSVNQPHELEAAQVTQVEKY